MKKVLKCLGIALLCSISVTSVIATEQEKIDHIKGVMREYFNVQPIRVYAERSWTSPIFQRATSDEGLTSFATEIVHNGFAYRTFMQRTVSGLCQESFNPWKDGIGNLFKEEVIPATHPREFKMLRYVGILAEGTPGTQINIVDMAYVPDTGTWKVYVYL